MTLRESGLKCEGINLFLADGAAAIQEVFHVHLSVIYSFEWNGFGLKYGSDNFKKTDRPALDAAAEKIRNALGLLLIPANR